MESTQLSIDMLYWKVVRLKFTLLINVTPINLIIIKKEWVCLTTDTVISYSAKAAREAGQRCSQPLRRAAGSAPEGPIRCWWPRA